MAIPIRLSGVDAPEVSPMVRGPDGSQPDVVTSWALPTGLWRMMSADTSPAGSAMWYVGTRAAQILGINRGTLRKKLQQYGLDD